MKFKNLFFLFAALTFHAKASEIKASERDLGFKTPCSPEKNEAVISFVGDILVHKALYETVVRETKHFSQLWNKADPLFKKADFSVGNLEGPAALGIDSGGKDHGDVGFIYDDFIYSGTNFLFNFHPRILSDLKNSGFDLLTGANNHSLDRGSIGIDKTLTASRETGLPVVGLRARSQKNNDTDFIKIADINSIRTAFIGCTEMTNGKADSRDQVLHCYKNSARILALIKTFSERNDVDAVIVFAHWGSEYTHVPELSQKEYGRKFIEYGATAVIGSHPHVLQPWEKVVTKNGREGLILYSLGNFVAGQAGVARRTGPVAYLGLSKGRNKNGKASIFGVGYTPTLRTGAVISPIGKKDSAEVLSYVSKMYGLKSFVEPAENVKTVLCRK